MGHYECRKCDQRFDKCTCTPQLKPALVFKQWHQYDVHYYLHEQHRPDWDSEDWIEVVW